MKKTHKKLKACAGLAAPLGSARFWECVREQIYRQWRINQALGLAGNCVDILATKQYADIFHKMLERETRANCAIPQVVRWHESAMPVLGMDCRTYKSEQMSFPKCDVNVLIPKGYRRIFAIPDYQSETYFCFLQRKARNFPKAKAPNSEVRRGGPDC